MSWFWGQKKADDPVKSLDGDLKQFLESQQPKPYIPPKKTEAPKDIPRPQHQEAPEEQLLPKESLYQDGRYKDLWKTYVPQQRIEQAISNPAQRVMDAKKQRKSTITQAALENCAFEEELKRNCFREGDAVNKIRARLTLCNRETKAFNRCFALQAKFLQALGYRGSAYADSEEDEAIQMHADKLYHRMMDYEAAVDEAKANGQPVPPLTSVFNPSRPAPTVQEIDLPQGLASGLSQSLAQMPPHERELAARAVLQETKVSQQYADDFFAYTTTLNEGRQDRQKKLVAAFGETLGKFFIPDAPNEQEIPRPDPKMFERDFWKNDPKPVKG